MNMVAFNWVDYTALSIIIFSILISMARGFVREAISLASWITAVWVAYSYGHDFGMRFLTMLEMGNTRSLVASAILFFSVLMVGALVNYAINSFVRMTGLSAIDRILGMAFGFGRGVLLIAVLILVGQLTDADKKPWWSASQTIPRLVGISDWLKSFVPEQFEKMKPLTQQKEFAINSLPSLQAVPPTNSTAILDTASAGVSIRLMPSDNSSITIHAPIGSAAQAPAAAASSPVSTVTAVYP